MDLDQVLQRLDRFLGTNPVIAGNVYIAPNATVLGDVSIGPGSSIWFQSVIRADINVIRIGSETNIQDGSILHVADRYGLADWKSSQLWAPGHSSRLYDRRSGSGRDECDCDGRGGGRQWLDHWGRCIGHERDQDPARITGPGFSRQNRPLVDGRRAKRHRRTRRQVRLCRKILLGKESGARSQDSGVTEWDV